MKKENEGFEKVEVNDQATPDAPFGFDESGEPKAPYGKTADGKIKVKAGRPKKTEASPSSSSATPSSSSATPSSSTPEAGKQTSISFEDLRKKVEENKVAVSSQAPAAPAPAVEVVQLIDGYMLIAILDALCPMVLKVLFKDFKNIPNGKMRMDRDQKESIEPLADIAAKEVQKYIPPLAAFVAVVSLNYYNNAVTYLENQKK